MIYVDEEFDICTLDIENDSSLWENIFVSVKKPFGKKSIVIGNIYKPPKDNLQHWKYSHIHSRIWTCPIQAKRK